MGVWSVSEPIRSRGPDCMVVGFTMQLAPITTNVSLNPAQARCTQYNIM